MRRVLQRWYGVLLVSVSGIQLVFIVLTFPLDKSLRIKLNSIDGFIRYLFHFILFTVCAFRHTVAQDFTFFPNRVSFFIQAIPFHFIRFYGDTTFGNPPLLD